MDELEITCLCPRVQIQDLGLKLTRGQVLYLEAAKAELSTDLTMVWRAGGVAKRPVRRFIERRQPVVGPEVNRTPSKKAQRPVVRPSGRQPTVAAPVRVATNPSRIDVEDLAQRVADKLAPVLLEAVNRQTRSLETVPVQFVGGEPFGLPDDMPAFIPSGIVQAGSDSSVQVEATEIEAASVKEAAAALKKAKPKAKRKAKRKTKKKAKRE